MKTKRIFITRHALRQRLQQCDNNFDKCQLLYKPDLEWLRSNAAILNLERAECIRDASSENGRKAIVYAAGNYIGQRELTKMGIIFCQLPDALHER